MRKDFSTFKLASCQAVLKNCVLSLFDSKPEHDLCYVVALLKIDTPHPIFEVSAQGRFSRTVDSPLNP